MPLFYDVHGLVLASQIDLPELEFRGREPNGEADLRIAIGKVQPQAAVPADGFSFGDADATMTIPGVGRYQVSHGQDVVIDPEPDADSSLVRLFLFGSVMGLVCHQRGLFPLHASAIEIDGEVVAFVGPPGQGKSTLAAHGVAMGGARFVADDILVVGFDEAGLPLAHPGMPNVKLWREALTALGRSADGLQPDWFRAEKFLLPMADHLVSEPLPLRRVYVLSDNPEAGPGPGRITPLGGAAAAANLIVNTYRVEYLDPMAQRPNHFAIAARLASAINVRLLARRRDLTQVGATVEAVLADLRDAPAELKQ
jgi:hypothetical protein